MHNLRCFVLEAKLRIEAILTLKFYKEFDTLLRLNTVYPEELYYNRNVLSKLLILI